MKYWLTRNKHIIFLFLLGLTPLRWFKDDYIYRAPEEEGYMDYSFLFEKYLYGWTSHTNNGLSVAPYDHCVLFPIGIFYKITSLLEIPGYVTQRLLILGIAWLTIYSFYKLVSHLTKDKLVGTISVLFYITPYYNFSTFFYTAKMLQMILMPTFCYLVIRYLETKKPLYLALNIIVLFSFQGIFVNLANGITTFIAYLFGLGYCITQVGWCKIKKDIKNIIYFFLTFIPVVYYVAVIYRFSIMQNTQEILHNATISVPTRLSNSKLLYIFDYFRGAWWDNPVENYNAWINFYDNTIIKFISFFLVCFLLFGLILKKNNYKKQMLFWTSIFLLFVFLVHGTSSPFGFVYEWFFRNVPLFMMFREPWAKFTPVVILTASILAGYTLKMLHNYKNFLYPTICLLILIHGYPFFSKNYFPHTNTITVQSDVRFPQYYYDLRDWSKKNKEHNILSLPLAYDATYLYKWYANPIGNYFDYGSRIDRIFFYFNLIGKYDVTNYTHHKFLSNYKNKFLPMLNIKYILFHKDVDVTSVPRTLSKSVIDYNSVKDVIEEKPVEVFGKLYIYKVKDKYFLPHIFGVSK